MSFLGTIFQFMSFGRYNTTAPTTTNGQPQELQCDVNGNLKIIIASATPAATAWIDTATLTYQGVVKAAPGTLYQLVATNENATNQRWLQFFDSASVPANTAVPKLQFKINAGQLVYFETARGRAFAAGMSWAVSSTSGTLTIDATSTFWVNAEFS